MWVASEKLREGAGCALQVDTLDSLRRPTSGVTRLDPLALGATAGLLIVVALLAGILPAHRAMKVDPVSALRAE